MRLLVSLLLSISLVFSETVIVPIPGGGRNQQSPAEGGGNGGGGGGGSGNIGAVIGTLIGIGLMILITKTVASKTSRPPRFAFVPFQFIAVHSGVLPEDINILDSLKIENLNFSLLEWKEEQEKLRDKLEGKVLILQPNYLYETFSSPGEAGGQQIQTERQSKALIAVLDTGADPNLVGSALAYVENMRPDPYRPEKHGTAVVYVAHRSGGVKVALYRVCSQNLCDSWSIIKALVDVVRKDINVVNMSFGTEVDDKAVELLIKLLTRKGIKFVAPVGNKPTEKLPFPARLKEVISVAGAPCFPEKICTRAKVRERYEFTTPFGTLKGTSFSSAHYAGKVAKDYLKDFKKDTDN